MAAPGAFERAAAQVAAIHVDDRAHGVLVPLKLHKAVAALAVDLHLHHHAEHLERALQVRLGQLRALRRAQLSD